LPDFVIMRGFTGYRFLHRCCAIEMKLPGQKPRKEQVEEMEKMTNAGIPCTVAYSFEEAVAFARQHLAL